MLVPEAERAWTSAATDNVSRGNIPKSSAKVHRVRIPDQPAHLHFLQQRLLDTSVESRAHAAQVTVAN